jgi:hypothetical protein
MKMASVAQKLSMTERHKEQNSFGEITGTGVKNLKTVPSWNPSGVGFRDNNSFYDIQ